MLEGLTLVVRDCLVAARAAPTELRVCGGGSASPLWLQLIADVTGVPVLRSTDTEAGAKGAYLVGLVATGAAAARRGRVDECVPVRHRFTPSPSAALYAELYADFLEIRPPAPPAGAGRGCGPGAGQTGPDVTGPEVWVGIDLGTQSVRALAVTATARCAGRGRRR